jgi:RHS repeat-associated protein
MIGYDYDPYGRYSINSSGDSASDFRYTGHYYHEKSGLSLAPFRAYDADLGRWLSRDPIAESGGINLYGYCGGDPINYVDGSGLAMYVPGTPDTLGTAYNPWTGKPVPVNPRTGEPLDPRDAEAPRSGDKSDCPSATQFALELAGDILKDKGQDYAMEKLLGTTLTDLYGTFSLFTGGPLPASSFGDATIDGNPAPPAPTGPSYQQQWENKTASKILNGY